MKKILLVDDEEDVRETIKASLEVAGYEVVEAENGDVAIKLIDDENWFCVISYIAMPGVSGVGVLKEVRGKGIKVPFILITGFASLLEIEEAFRIGAQAFLAKPFNDEELFSKLKELEVYTQAISRPEAEIHLDDFYASIDIDDFIVGRKITYPIYLKLSSVKYVKIAFTGEDIDADKLRNLKNNGVRFLYLKNSDFKKYITRNILLARKLLEFKEIENEKKRAFFIGLTKNIIQYEFHKDMNEEILSSSLFAIKNTLKFIEEKKDFYEALESLQVYSPSVVEHSLLVSLLASGIAMSSGQYNYKTVELVSLSALYHDLGLRELPKEISETEYSMLREDEIKVYQTHPQLSCQLLSSIKDIPEAIPQSVLHHHEYCDGSGFPFGIGRMKIHPIARIVCLANDIAYEWVKKKSFNASLKDIVLKLEKKKDLYDREYVAAAVKMVTENSRLLRS